MGYSMIFTTELHFFQLSMALELVCSRTYHPWNLFSLGALTAWIYSYSNFHLISYFTQKVWFKCLICQNINFYDFWINEIHMTSILTYFETPDFINSSNYVGNLAVQLCDFILLLPYAINITGMPFDVKVTTCACPPPVWSGMWIMCAVYHSILALETQLKSIKNFSS